LLTYFIDFIRLIQKNLSNNNTQGIKIKKVLAFYKKDKARIKFLRSKLKLGKISFQAEMFYLGKLSFLKYFRIVLVSQPDSSSFKNFEDVYNSYDIKYEKNFYYYFA